MKACVIFDTRFGNTEKIARALESGIKDAGVETRCLSSKDVDIGSLKEYDLICVGTPTEMFSAYTPTKEFFRKLKGADLTGKHGFAFDTKVSSGLSGSAAKLIERELKGLGVRMVAPRESAIVSTSRDRSGITGATLKGGEELRFQEIGRQLGAGLAAKAKPQRIEGLSA